MLLIVGALIVLGSVAGGYLMHGGVLGALWQLNELVIIGGAALGALIIGTPISLIKALLADIGHLALVETRDNPWLEWQRRRASHDLLHAIPALAHLAPAILSVSERFDGDGLPYGRKRDEIPLIARIARLVRDFDLASQGWWPGQPAAISARACFELVALAGQTVDPALVHAWLRVLDREVAANVA